jgi:hypothetical protein
MRRIVWTSVASALLIGGAALNAAVGNTDFVIACGSAAIATAILSLREK